MPQQSARITDQQVRKHATRDERDTLETIDQDFLRDQLEALLASPTLARVADRHSEGRDDPKDFAPALLRDSEPGDRVPDSESERVTEPSVDTLLLRAAFNAGLK